ncbi:MAG: hypothetical protein ACE5JL_02680 [Dehalococcoidia bacterium]
MRKFNRADKVRVRKGVQDIPVKIQGLSGLVVEPVLELDRIDNSNTNERIETEYKVYLDEVEDTYVLKEGQLESL